MKKILPLIFLFIFSAISFAQTPVPPPPQGENASPGFGAPADDAPDAPDTPIDEFLPFLLMAAILIGAYFIIKNARKQIAD